MADTVKIPGAKKPLPKWAVFGGLGVVGLLGFQYYKSKSSKAATTAAAAATSTDQYPPDGTAGNPSDPYSTDPATGQTYGNESAGSGGIYGAYGTGGGGWDPNTGMYTDPNGAQCQNPDANGYCPSPTGSNGPPFSDNSQWSGWVIQTMTANNPALDVGALTDALGLYLAGQPVGTSQQTLVFDAIAIGGDPPVSGPNGYPPKIASSGSKGGGQHAHNPVAGLHVTQEGYTSAEIAWTKDPHATSYTIGGGHAVITGTTARVGGLKRHSKTVLSVRAHPGTAGASDAHVTVDTK